MHIDVFRGISPRTPEHMLGIGVATRAHNVNLSRGSLLPWREPKPVAVVDSDSMSLFNYGCCYFGYPSCVSTAAWVPDSGRFFITGRSSYPEVAVVSDCEATYYRLGVPTPMISPAVSGGSAPSSVEDSYRNYVITYVNLFGEESAPSFPSADVSIYDGGAVTVSGWGAQDEAYGVKYVRVYRTATGFRSGAEKTQDPVTAYLMVAEVPISQGSYEDTISDMYLGCALDSREVQPPPANLRGITVIDDTAILAGFVGNKIYFSRNNQPHNWPLAQEITLDHNIVSISSDNGNLYVTTAGVPYIVDGAGDCTPRPIRNVTKMDYPYADIACGYSCSRVVTPFGLLYASNEGLVLFSSRSAPIVITDAVLSPKQWADLRPDTTRLAYWEGWVFCVTSSVSFMFLLDTTTYRAQASIADMVTISDAPLDMRLSSSGALLFLTSGGSVQQWDASNKLRPYEWSCSILSGVQTWFPMVSVTLQGATEFTLEGGNGASITRRIASDKMIRCSRLGRNNKHYIRFAGTGEVFRVRLGATKTEEAYEVRR